MNTHQMRAQIEKWTDSDRREIAIKAIDDIENNDSVAVLTIVEDNELLAIATIDDGELLNMATKRRGLGSNILERVAEYALRNGLEIKGLSTDQAVRFYAYNGFEIEGFPGENNGIQIWWPTWQMELFLAGGGERERMQDAARAEFDEWVDEYELDVY